MRTRRTRLVALAAVVLAALAAALLVHGDTIAGHGVRVTAACPLAPVSAPGGGTWACRLDEEFDGRSLDRRVWTVERSSSTGFHSGAECYVDDPAHVAVRSGALVLTATRSPSDVRCGGRSTDLLSGMVHTRDHVSTTYGRVEIRAQLPAEHGLQPALWMYPESLRYGRWPRSGEIDLAELFGVPVATAHLHYLSTAGRAAPGGSCPVVDPGHRWHTYALDWTPRAITVSYDGAVCWRTPRWTPAAPLAQPAPFDQPFFVLLTLADGIGTNAPDSGTAYPATMRVDFVRIWSP